MKLRRQLLLVLLVLVPATSAGILGLSLLDLEREHRDARHLAQVVTLMQGRVLELESARALENRVEDLPRLFPEPDVASFLGQLEIAANAAGVRCDEVEVPRSQTEGRQAYELAGKGSAAAIARFLAEVEQNERLPIVQHCRVLATRDGQTRFELQLVVFHKLAGGPR